MRVARHIGGLLQPFGLTYRWSLRCRLREFITPLKDTDKFVSYTNANKDRAGPDVNRVRFSVNARG